MSHYLLTNRDRRNCIQDFYTSHPAHTIVSGTKADISQLSFVDFCCYLGIELTPDQVNVSELVFRQKQTTVVSSHGVGKSSLASLLILYTVIVLKGLGITTAPTARQVSKIIFREINTNFQKLKRSAAFSKKYGINFNKSFSIGQTFIKELDVKTKDKPELSFWYSPKDIDTNDNESNNYEGLGYAFGFTSKHNDSNSFQGLHYAGFMLIIADEACGISFEIAEAIEACATGYDNHVLYIGNPIAINNPFEKDAKERGHYKMTCFTHPNVSPYYKERGRDNWQLVDNSCMRDDWRPKINGAVTPRWIEEARAKYGEDSLFWRTRVLAKFPRLGDGAGVLIPYSFVEASTDLEDVPMHMATQLAYTPLLVGVDVGESNDPTVVAIAQYVSTGEGDKSILLVRSILELETRGDGLQAERNYQFVVDTIRHFLNSTMLKEHNVFVSIDNTGIGVSMTRDLLKNHNFRIADVHFASSASNTKSFKNIRAEMAWVLRRLYIEGIIKIYPSVLKANSDSLKYEIEGVSYTQDPRTEQILLTPKDVIKSILKRSPNIFDAVCLLTQSLRMLDENEV